MKLKTSDIVPIVIKYSLTHVHDRFESDDEEAHAAVSNPKLWKRHNKSKVGKLIVDFRLISLEDFKFGWEFEDTLDEQELSEDCIGRHFINDVLSDGLDATVITDPTDTKILRINWHCD